MSRSWKNREESKPDGLLSARQQKRAETEPLCSEKPSRVRTCSCPEGLVSQPCCEQLWGARARCLYLCLDGNLRTQKGCSSEHKVGHKQEMLHITLWYLNIEFQQEHTGRSVNPCCDWNLIFIKTILVWSLLMQWIKTSNDIKTAA